MESIPDTASGAPAVTREAAIRAAKVRRFSSGVSIVMMVVCNAVFLLGIWVTGVNFERLVRTPDVYSAQHDICLRLAYRNIPGTADPVQFCSEWINLGDSTGQTHKFEKDTEIKQGADGKFYLDYGPLIDYRFFAVVGFVITILICGLVLKRHVVNRYRIRLEASARETAPIP